MPTVRTDTQPACTVRRLTDRGDGIALYPATEGEEICYVYRR